MAAPIPAGDALRSLKRNPVHQWNLSTDSSTRSTNPNDASNRIHDGFADIRSGYQGPRLPRDTPVFTMGSCFAREIEKALVERGGRVISIDRSIWRPEFHDSAGRVRTGFFHRFTPASMALEFRWSLGLQEGWTDDALIVDGSDGRSIDMNYTRICHDASPAAVRTRRTVAADLVRRVREARIVIVTLGLTESWHDRATGLPVNAIDLRHLKSHLDDFELRRLDVAATVDALEAMLAAIASTHCDGDFQLFVTVSPVPFTAIFSGQDVIVANATSKSTLRAAAAEFVERHDRAHYFPSYEIVTNSDPARAWRPDRIHVERGMVRHVMDRFMDAVFAS